MRRGALLLFLVSLAACAGKAPPIPPPAPSAEGDLTLFLIGDGGKPRVGGDPVLLALKARIASVSGRAITVFLGDNVYDSGLPPGGGLTGRRWSGVSAIRWKRRWGGYFNWQDHVFPLTRAWRGLWLPLPGIGSLYPLVRTLGATSQDLSSDENRHMREALEEAFRSNPPLILVDETGKVEEPFAIEIP